MNTKHVNGKLCPVNSFTQEDCEFVISLGETTRHGDSSLYFTGQHLRNIEASYETFTVNDKSRRLLGLDYIPCDVPVIITGMPDIDMFLHKVRTCISRSVYRHKQSPACASYNAIKECIASVVEAVRCWLDAVPREEILQGSGLGYKGVRVSRQTSFIQVTEETDRLCAAVEAWLNEGSTTTLTSIPGNDEYMDLKALQDMNSVLSAPSTSFWRVVEKRLTTEDDHEPDIPEGNPRTMWDTISDMHSSNETQIATIESTNRFLGGFSMPVLATVFTLIRHYSRVDAALYFMVAAIATHFIATLSSFLLLLFSSLRKSLRHVTKVPPPQKVTEIGKFSDNKVQREFYGYEDAFFQQMYDIVESKVRVGKKYMDQVIITIKSLTKSAHELSMLEKIHCFASGFYNFTVALYAVAAILYLRMS